MPIAYMLTNFARGMMRKSSQSSERPFFAMRHEMAVCRAEIGGGRLYVKPMPGYWMSITVRIYRAFVKKRPRECVSLFGGDFFFNVKFE